MARVPYFSVDEQRFVNGGNKPAYDYDSNEFYNAIEQLAKGGANNKEIAAGLFNLIGLKISYDDFEAMANGLVHSWTDEENNIRGGRIKFVLANARLATNRLVKATYLKTALGLNQTKTTTTVKRRMRIDGQLTNNEDIQTTEVVSGIAPNLQALGQWLYHHDEQWRKVTKGLAEDDTDAPPTPEKINKGVDISQWIDKELMDKNLANVR